MSTVTWNKPARERHAHVGDILRNYLEGLSKAAEDLALYLFEYVIDGRYEWIDLYQIPLGLHRSTEKRTGKPYAKNTLREAIKTLAARGLVIIERKLFGGMFRLTVSHPGEKRPFFQPVRTLTSSSQIRPTRQNSDELAPETLAAPFPITEEFRETAEQAAAIKNFLRNKEERHQSESVEFHEAEHCELGLNSDSDLINRPPA